MIFVSFALSISDLGIGSALIQQRDADAHVIESGASLRLLLSLVLVALLIGIAPLLAQLYREETLTLVIWALSPLVVLNFAGFVARVSLTKSLRFKEVTLPEIAGG